MAVGRRAEAAAQGADAPGPRVLCNGGIPTLLALAAFGAVGFGEVALSAAAHPSYTALGGSFLGYYACCCGDTWASELGILSQGLPRLVTTLRPVRKGTNGAVSGLGLAASLGGGLFIGLVFFLAAAACGCPQPLVVPLAAGFGLLGSLIDSVVGATLQYSGYCWDSQKVVQHPGVNVTPITGRPLLTNNGVNLVSASLSAVLCAAATLRLFP